MIFFAHRYSSPRVSSAGFTLFEILAAMAILAVGLGMVVVSFGQLADRDLDNQAVTITRWMQSLSERSVLEGGLYGFRVVGDQLQAVSWFDHQWHVVEHEGLLILPENINFYMEEDETHGGFISAADAEDLALDQSKNIELGIDAQFLLEDGQLIEPLMVFMPSGEPVSEGNLHLQASSGKSLAVFWRMDGVIDYLDSYADSLSI